MEPAQVVYMMLVTSRARFREICTQHTEKGCVVSGRDLVFPHVHRCTAETACTFEREMSPEAIRLRTSAANPIAWILSGLSSWVDAAAVARSSSTTPDEGSVTRACRRSREDKE